MTAPVTQCGRRDARADMLKSFGYPTADTVARAQAYHAILTDLIAELRDEDEIAGNDNRSCGACLAIFVAVHRAEARLREVSGDE